MLGTPFFTVVPAKDGKSCANSTAFIKLPSSSKKAGIDNQTASGEAVDLETSGAVRLDPTINSKSSLMIIISFFALLPALVSSLQG